MPVAVTFGLSRQGIVAFGAAEAMLGLLGLCLSAVQDIFLLETLGKTVSLTRGFQDGKMSHHQLRTLVRRLVAIGFFHM